MIVGRRAALGALAVGVAVAAGACASSSATARSPVAATTTTARPGPAPVERVVILGDSMMYDVEPALRAALLAGGATTVEGGTLWGTGLTYLEKADWREGWPPELARVRPEVVVVLLGAWDVLPEQVGPSVDAWAARFRPVVEEAAALLRSTGAEVVWLGLPPVRVPEVAAALGRFDTVVAGVARHTEGVRFVDFAALVAGPDGGFAADLPAGGGRAGRGGPTVRARKPDGIHFCPEAAARAAEAVVGVLAREGRLTEPAASAWRDGPWRADGRYPPAECPPVAAPAATSPTS